MVAGKWYTIGASTGFNGPQLEGFECPSVYPLPRLTPGFGDQESWATTSRGIGTTTLPPLPTHVHKKGGWCGDPGMALHGFGPESTGCDFWQLGTYKEGSPRELGAKTETTLLLVSICMMKNKSLAKTSSGQR